MTENLKQRLCRSRNTIYSKISNSLSYIASEEVPLNFVLLPEGEDFPALKFLPSSKKLTGEFFHIICFLHVYAKYKCNNSEESIGESSQENATFFRDANISDI